MISKDMKTTILLFQIDMFILLFLQLPTAVGQNIVVTSNKNSGAGTLRSAISNVGEGDTITFANDMTITLSYELSIWSKSLTIDGRDKNIIISGNNSCRAFYIDGEDDKIYNLLNLTIANGKNLTSSGGGMYADMQHGTLNVNNCTFSNNSAKMGGGVAAFLGFTITNCNFTGNTATELGGGVFVGAGGSYFNCTFIGNTANINGGGAYANYYGNFTNCLFSNNTALQNGGGVGANDGGVFINCIYNGNMAAAEGGGIYTVGGGSYTNCTIIENSSVSSGGGASVYGGNFKNCIFWNNTGNEISNGYYMNISYCAVKGGYSGSVPGDGMVNLSESPFVGSSDFRLSKISAGGSSCINTGLNSANTTTSDFRGQARIQNGRIDIGAYEWTLGLDPGPVILNLQIDNISLDTKETRCFNAYDSITVSKTAPVILAYGSKDSFIAGKSIRFLPGFFAEAGSDVHAWITLDSSFCDGTPESPIVYCPENKSSEMEDHKGIAGITCENEIQVYPNPSRGIFTLKISNAEGQSQIRIYDIWGKNIFFSDIRNQPSKEIDLSEKRKGFYLIKIIKGRDQFIKKILIR